MLWRIVELVYGVTYTKPPKIQTANRTAICWEAWRHWKWSWKCSFYRSLHALVSLNMSIVLSRVMTWIKCRLSSSIFFFFLDSRLSFNESSTSKTLWTLQEEVRSWIFVYLGRHGKTIKATPKKRSLWETPYVWLTLSWTTTNKCNIGREKKKGETYRIGSALRQGEVKTLQHSSYTMWWFRDSLRIRWRHAPQQIAVPFAVCTFGGFGEIAFTSRLKRALRFEKFHVMLTNWMFSQSVWCSAKTCVRCTIRHYADPFHATLHCLHVRCTILHYAEPFHATLHHLCVHCTIRHYAEPFHAMLQHLCVRYTIWD